MDLSHRKQNIEASEYVGIAQMLTYAHTSLAQQSAVWGLITNSFTYQFFYLSKDEYQYMPSLSIRERDRALQLLQVLRAIRTWTPAID